MRIPALVVLPLVAIAAAPLPALESALLDQHGRAHSLAPPFDGPVLVDFAASWCGPCRISLPRVEALAERHPELQVLVVSVDSSAEGRDRLVRDLGLRVPVVWDADHRLAETYRPPTMPSSFLLAPDGSVLHMAAGSGADDWEVLVDVVARTLRETSGRP